MEEPPNLHEFQKLDYSYLFPPSFVIEKKITDSDIFETINKKTFRYLMYDLKMKSEELALIDEIKDRLFPELQKEG